jgi:hypothetical protein
VTEQNSSTVHLLGLGRNETGSRIQQQEGDWQLLGRRVASDLDLENVRHDYEDLYIRARNVAVRFPRHWAAHELSELAR